MLKHFSEYYRPSDDEFKALWAACVVVPDANVLLNLYRYKGATRDRYLEVLEALSRDGRLWIPHQVGYEFHGRRPDVIGEQEAACTNLETLLSRELSSIESRLGLTEDHTQAVCKGVRQAIDQLQKGGLARPDYLVDDPILDRLTSILDGCVGEAYSESEMETVHRDAASRFAANVPPGYADAKKSDVEASHGDYIIWRQTLDHAAAHSVPIVFVTGDAKEDWWRMSRGKTLGPRPELIREMKAEAKVACYIYSASQFLEYAARLFKVDLDTEAVDDVRTVGERAADNESRTLRPSLRERRAELLERLVACEMSVGRASELADEGDDPNAQDELEAALALRRAVSRELASIERRLGRRNPAGHPPVGVVQVVGLRVGPDRVRFWGGRLTDTRSGWRLEIVGADATAALAPENVGQKFGVRVETRAGVVQGRATLTDVRRRREGGMDVDFISSDRQLRLDDVPATAGGGD